MYVYVCFLCLQDPPTSVKIETSQSVVVEGVDNLVMTCTVDGSPGNPTIYTYYWTSPRGDSSETRSTQLTVLMADLDATLHDGTWQCQAGNAGGKSPAFNLDITVNGNTRVKYHIYW